MRKSLKSTATLSNLLPTGAVFINQLLSLVLTNKGQCTTLLHHTLTIFLLVISAVVSLFLLFADTVKDENGKVRHGIITFNGLWVIDAAEVKLTEQEMARYKVKAVDFVHASLTVFLSGGAGDGCRSTSFCADDLVVWCSCCFRQSAMGLATIYQKNRGFCLGFPCCA